MSDILAQIIARKREIVAERRRRRPVESLLRDMPTRPPRDFAAALREPGLSVIAEFKRRSPSKGGICNFDVRAIVREYFEAGASAISILTDEEFFGGTDDDLRIARITAGVPILRKDFTIDSYQVYESRAFGADAILLIVSCLDDALLRDLLVLAAELRLGALVEVHDEHELDRAFAAGAKIIGVNNRDLRTFEVSLATSLRLRPRIPADCIAAAESGIRTAADAQSLARAGFDAMLVGESLLTSENPPGKLRELLGREPASSPDKYVRERRHTLVKICGLTNVEDARAAADAGANLVGVVFAESPRRVTPAQADACIRPVSRECIPIGVFKNQPPAFVSESANECDIEWIQLHGDEPPETSPQYGMITIRRITVSPDETRESLVSKLERYRPYAAPMAYGEPQPSDSEVRERNIKLFLLDPGAGSGKIFDWTIAGDLPHRFFLSGGLTPENVGDAIRLLRPYGVDVSSGVEHSPGRKDHAKMRDFVQAVREADASHS